MPQVVGALAAIYAVAAAAWAAVGAITIAGVSLTTIIVSTAVSIGLSELARLLTPTPRIAVHKQNIRQALAPRWHCYGRHKLGGVYSFLAVRTPWLYYVILICSHEIDAFEEHWLGEYSVDLDGGGNVTYVNESPTPHIYQLDDGNYIAYIKNQPGHALQPAYAELIDAFPETYSATDHCNGIATALVAFADPGTSFGTRYPSGLPPYNATIRGAKVYDPRDDTQNWYDSSTWKWSENAVLIVMDYIWNNDGMRLPFDRLIAPAISVWIEQANIADQIVALQDGGSEPRYRLGGTYELTEPPKQVLPRMLDPIDGRLGLRADGAIVIDVGQWMEPADTIEDAQIVSYIGLSKGRQQADIRNEVRASFVSPDYKFVEQEMDPWLNETSIAVDGLKTMTMDLTWAPSHRQARVRAKIESYRQDPDGWCGQIVTTAYGLKFLEPNGDGTKKRTMNFVISELGINGSFEIQRFAFDVRSGQCTFTVLSLTSDAYAWNPATDEGTAPALPEAIAPDNIENPSSLTVTIVNYRSDGGNVTAQLQAVVGEPTQPGLNLELQYALHNDLISDNLKDWAEFPSTGAWSGQTGDLAENTYDVRCAFYNSRGFYSDQLYERGFVITFGTAPGPPTSVVLSSPTGGEAKVAWNNPNSANMDYAIVWRNTSNSFGTATNISGDIYGAPNQPESYIDTPGSGTWWYWVTAQDVTNHQSTDVASTPPSITI
ncbi:MAG TPA: hypothetical protein VNX86_04795 [Rhizomicrobium sp.]|jgi:hypothetical protein|nr:hypothetical protein [Rhizomicrobium sp.]